MREVDSGSNCWREDASYQTGACSRDNPSIVAGYRLVGGIVISSFDASKGFDCSDSAQGAVFEAAPRFTPPPLPPHAPPTTAWPHCWIDSYGRGGDLERSLSRIQRISLFVSW